MCADQANHDPARQTFYNDLCYHIRGDPTTHARPEYSLELEWAKEDACTTFAGFSDFEHSMGILAPSPTGLPPMTVNLACQNGRPAADLQDPPAFHAI